MKLNPIELKRLEIISWVRKMRKTHTRVIVSDYSYHCFFSGLPLKKTLIVLPEEVETKGVIAIDKPLLVADHGAGGVPRPFANGEAKAPHGLFTATDFADEPHFLGVGLHGVCTHRKDPVVKRKGRDGFVEINDLPDVRARGKAADEGELGLADGLIGRRHEAKQRAFRGGENVAVVGEAYGRDGAYAFQI